VLSTHLSGISIARPLTLRHKVTPTAYEMGQLYTGNIRYARLFNDLSADVSHGRRFCTHDELYPGTPVTYDRHALVAQVDALVPVQVVKVDTLEIF
jgi:hypothetical protein